MEKHGGRLAFFFFPHFGFPEQMTTTDSAWYNTRTDDRVVVCCFFLPRRSASSSSSYLLIVPVARPHARVSPKPSLAVQSGRRQQEQSFFPFFPSFLSFAFYRPCIIIIIIVEWRPQHRPRRFLTGGGFLHFFFFFFLIFRASKEVLWSERMLLPAIRVTGQLACLLAGLERTEANNFISLDSSFFPSMS
ncbi:hypothetical protein BKA80DRAFT_34096 [Phyllosticta citrichinensis]